MEKEGKQGILYPIMVVAGLSVTAFSAIGIAAMTGHLASADPPAAARAPIAGAPAARKPADKSEPAAQPAQAPAAPAPRRPYLRIRQAEPAAPAVERAGEPAMGRIGELVAGHADGRRSVG